MNQQQAKKFFEQHKTRYILAQFVDIHGAAKAKAVPVEHLEMVLNEGAGFAGFALWGFGMGPEGPDYMAVGDLSTLQDIPWMPGYARLICNGVVNKKPYAYCSRGARMGVWDRPTPPTDSTSHATTTRACTAAARYWMKWWQACAPWASM